MKATIQKTLKRIGIYQRIKTSIAYDLYWGVANRKLLQERADEVRFFQCLLGTARKPLIFDIGANIGHKTDIFLRLGASVVAVDPDRSNQEILRQRFLALRMVRRPVTIVGKAVSDRVGTQTFFVDAPGSAKNTLNRKWVETLRGDASRFGEVLNFRESRQVETTTLDALCEQFGEPLYVKIDVEGHESEVLAGLRRPIPYVSFEVNLPEFLDEAIQCVETLSRLGNYRFAYATDCRGTINRFLAKADFLSVLRSCREPSVEVFAHGISPAKMLSQ